MSSLTVIAIDFACYYIDCHPGCYLKWPLLWHYVLLCTRELTQSQGNANVIADSDNTTATQQLKQLSIRRPYNLSTAGNRRSRSSRTVQWC